MLINLNVCCLSAIALLAVDTVELKTKNTKWHSTLLLSNPDCSLYDSWYKTHHLNIELHASGQEFSDASHCFCMTLPNRKYIKKIVLLPYLFLEPIAAHDFTNFQFNTSFYAASKESSCEEHCSL